MPDLVFAIPGDPDQRTGGYLYDRRLREALVGLGWVVEPLRLPDGFPAPAPEEMAETDRLLGGIDDGRLVLIDGLAFGAMPDIAAKHADRLALMALVHHPVGYETGLSEERAAFLIHQEREALRHVRRVLVTSATTLRTLVDDFDVPPEKVQAALPGTDAAPLAQGSGGVVPALLAVGSILPRKDFVGLVSALGHLHGLPWTLTIAGSMERDPSEADRLRQEIARHDLGGRIQLTGELAEQELAGLLDKADLFISSSRYEGFGMALAEALARGLPVVAVAGGAVADWMDPDATLLVPPDRPHALCEALRRVLSDASLLRRLREAALLARARLPTWNDCARQADFLLRSALDP